MQKQMQASLAVILLHYWIGFTVTRWSLGLLIHVARTWDNYILMGLAFAIAMTLFHKCWRGK